VSQLNTAGWGADEWIMALDYYNQDKIWVPSDMAATMPNLWELLNTHVDVLYHLDDMFGLRVIEVAGGGDEKTYVNDSEVTDATDRITGENGAGTDLLFGYSVSAIGSLIVYVGQRVAVEIAIIATDAFLEYWMPALRRAKKKQGARVAIKTSRGYGAGKRGGGVRPPDHSEAKARR